MTRGHRSWSMTNLLIIIIIIIPTSGICCCWWALFQSCCFQRLCHRRRRCIQQCLSLWRWSQLWWWRWWWLWSYSWWTSCLDQGGHKKSYSSMKMMLLTVRTWCIWRSSAPLSKEKHSSWSLFTVHVVVIVKIASGEKSNECNQCDFASFQV